MKLIMLGLSLMILSGAAVSQDFWPVTRMSADYWPVTYMNADYWPVTYMNVDYWPVTYATPADK